jgi:hypothetical protein
MIPNHFANWPDLMAQIDDMEKAFSLERFARYVTWAGGDREYALALYTLNTQVSEALYIALQTLEVSLRNRIHHVMMAAHGERWFEISGLIKTRHQAVSRRCGCPETHPAPGGSLQRSASASGRPCSARLTKIFGA